MFVLFFSLKCVDVTRSTTYQKYITVLTPYTLHIEGNKGTHEQII